MKSLLIFSWDYRYFPGRDEYATYEDYVRSGVNQEDVCYG
jgi:hypothetical protein